MKTLVITGASKGIGYQVALKAVAQGMRVINISRSPADAPGIENFAIDLAAADAEEKVKTLVDRQLNNDKSNQAQICLVHNAAILKNDSADNTETGSFVEVMNTNLVAPHILNQAILPLMNTGSSIIYIGSTLSEKAVANTYSYVVSKHAIVGMMRATCQDLKGQGIHTACICPGFTDTEMLRTHIGSDPEVISNITSLSTFGRLVAPDEIAACVMFAAQNAVTNGSVIHANLGQIEH